MAAVQRQPLLELELAWGVFSTAWITLRSGRRQLTVHICLSEKRHGQRVRAQLDSTASWYCDPQEIMVAHPRHTLQSAPGSSKRASIEVDAQAT